MGLNFEYFYDWVRKNLDINLDAYKEKQLQRRIGTVMKKAGATTLEEYSTLISQDENHRKAFLDYITINVTEFFRNKDIFQEFETLLINNLLPKFNDIKIWSAACSIGAEPYSISIILNKYNKFNKYNYKIIATDIDEGILKRANQGNFKPHEIRNIKQEDLNQYFSFEDNHYNIKDEFKEKITFKKHDLILDRYESGFHAVVCRNVAIYFKNETKEEIYRKISESLVSGGIFFIGATESIYNPKEYGLRKLSTFIYEKI